MFQVIKLPIEYAINKLVFVITTIFLSLSLQLILTTISRWLIPVSQVGEQIVVSLPMVNQPSSTTTTQKIIIPLSTLVLLLFRHCNWFTNNT